MLPNPQALGITEKEATIYEILLNRGESDAASLISSTLFKRPTVYKSLNTLKEKGLVRERKQLGTTIFSAESPNKLLEMTDRRTRELTLTQQMLSEIMPLLQSAYVLSTERPVVSTFTGTEGIIKVFQDTLSEGAEISAVVQSGEVEPKVLEYLESVYVPERVRLSIPAKVIVASGEGNIKYVSRDQLAKRMTLMVPNARFPFKHEVNVYGSKVAFIHYIKGDPQIAIVINHPQVAATMRAWFDLAWLGAEQVNIKKGMY